MIPDEQGADTLPMAFVATLLITAAIVGIAVAGVKNVSPTIDSGAVDVQAEALAADCQALLSCAPRYLDDPGSPQGVTKIVDLNLPRSTEYFELGDHGVISYTVAGSKKAIVVDAGVSFRARGDGTVASVLQDEGVVLHGGRYRLEIEYACDALGNRFLLVGSTGIDHSLLI